MFLAVPLSVSAESQWVVNTTYDSWSSRCQQALKDTDTSGLPTNWNVKPTRVGFYLRNNDTENCTLKDVKIRCYDDIHNNYSVERDINFTSGEEKWVYFDCSDFGYDFSTGVAVLDWGAWDSGGCDDIQCAYNSTNALGCGGSSICHYDVWHGNTTDAAIDVWTVPSGDFVEIDSVVLGEPYLDYSSITAFEGWPNLDEDIREHNPTFLISVDSGTVVTYAEIEMSIVSEGVSCTFEQDISEYSAIDPQLIFMNAADLVSSYEMCSDWPVGTYSATVRVKTVDNLWSVDYDVGTWDIGTIAIVGMPLSCNDNDNFIVRWLCYIKTGFVNLIVPSPSYLNSFLDAWSNFDGGGLFIESLVHDTVEEFADSVDDSLGNCPLPSLDSTGMVIEYDIDFCDVGSHTWVTTVVTTSEPMLWLLVYAFTVGLCIAIVRGVFKF